MTGGGDYNLILVVGGKNIGAKDVTRYAHHLNLNIDKILFDWIVCIPGFTLEKYRRLQRSRLSIFSRICFGGTLSHTLGLPFRSPFVNLWLSDKDYIKFLRTPRVYMGERIFLKEWNWNNSEKINYPIVTLANVEINMNHYPDFNEALEIWERRKQRVNWYNLFVTMYTDDKKILREFDELPYGKKVCFVPFKSGLDSAWYINPQIKNGWPLWSIVTHFSDGDPFYYDPFDMLLYGKKSQLINM